MINFYKGPKTSYSNDDHSKDIYFTTDTHEIITGTKSYGKNADKSLTTENIIIEGGPLASQSLKDSYPEGVIPAGTSIQDILSKFLCDEKWPIPSVTLATLTASVIAPTPVLNAPSKSGSLVEVGDLIVVLSFTAADTEPKGITATTVTGFTYGLSTEDDNTADKNSDGDIIKSLSAKRTDPLPNGKHSMTVTITGMSNPSFTQPTDNATASEVKFDRITGKAEQNSNMVSVTETGVTYSASVRSIEPVYICSNLGNTKGRKFEGVTESILSATPNPSTNSAELIGVYAIYSTGTLYGSFSTTEDDLNAWRNKDNKNYIKFSNETTPQRMKLSSVTNKTATFYGYIGFGADDPETKKIVLLPTGWKIKEVYIPSTNVEGRWITSENQIATRIRDDFEEETGYDFINNSGATSKYTKWLIEGSTAPNLFKLIISKTN